MDIKYIALDVLTATAILTQTINTTTPSALTLGGTTPMHTPETMLLLTYFG